MFINRAYKEMFFLIEWTISGYFAPIYHFNLILLFMFIFVNENGLVLEPATDAAWLDKVDHEQFMGTYEYYKSIRVLWIKSLYWVNYLSDAAECKTTGNDAD